MGLLQKFLDPFGVTSDIYHAVTGTSTAQEKRKMATDANNQIGLYKNQSELATNELNRARDEKDAQKRRINEKQIRSLRRNFRPAGFLDNAVGTSDKLGG